MDYSAPHIQDNLALQAYTHKAPTKFKILKEMEFLQKEKIEIIYKIYRIHLMQRRKVFDLQLMIDKKI